MPAYDIVKPGVLEAFCGPMKSGKTAELIARVNKINFMDGFDMVFIKPRIDKRDKTVKSRFGNTEYNCFFVDEDDPYKILNVVNRDHNLVAIDEIQFFNKGIEKVVEKLLSKNKNVIVAGLDLDFRGEPFGMMPYLLSVADEVIKLRAICSYPKCNASGSRTQRLINGKPANYKSPLILIEDYDNKKETYEPRCVMHHKVPGKPKR